MRKILKIKSIVPCKIIKRLNRFVVSVRVKNKIIKASLNNTGRLEQFLVKGKIGYLLPLNNPQKTKYRLSFVKEDKNSASIIDTNLQMKCFEIALEKKLISWLKGAKILKRNAKIDTRTNTNTHANLNGNYCDHYFKRRTGANIHANLSERNRSVSLIDYLIEYKNKKYYLEIKSAVMKENGFAMYPDCPSLRGQKHIKELINHSQNSVILFIAGMKNIKAFKPNKNADEKIYELLKIAKNKRVKIKAIQIYLDLKTKNIILKDDNLKVVI
jgi:sugar fermentation stimulation protein A